MITDTGDVQIIDFGVAAELEGYKDKRTTVMGTLNWMAPEMHKRDITGLQYGVEVRPSSMPLERQASNSQTY